MSILVGGLRHRMPGLSISPRTSCNFATVAGPRADFTHAIIGGGAVGLAIARRLAQTRPQTTTVLLERHAHVGTETSSRNSEVIHAGIYYGADSLKTSLCIRGREMMYALAREHNIPYANMGKWLVAQDEIQMGELEKLHAFTKEIGVETRWLDGETVRRLEPDVRAEAGVLESPTTGIIDSHSFMQFLRGEFEDAGGDVAVNAVVQGIHPPGAGSDAFTLMVQDKGSGAVNEITAEVLINSAGLAACEIQNMVLPPEKHIKPMYAKGNYFSYSSRTPRASRLVYPAPVPGHGGLGTHLTLDLQGQIRFGPDVEWVDDPSDVSVTVDEERMRAAVADIKTYFPGLDETKIVPDYAGIRPKLGKASATVGGKGFMDFHIKREELVGGGCFVNLVGIESPGLTSSLAIAEMVEGLVHR